MTANSSKSPFPLPSEIESVPGTEGWEDMYPFYTRVQPEDDDIFWFYNSMHFSDPMPAFDSITAEVPYTAMGANTTRLFAFPTTLGVEYRIINGRVYITAHAVTDPEEIEKRSKVFGRRAAHYYENWDALYEKWEKKMRALIKKVDAIEVPELGEFDAEEVVTEARGYSANHELRCAWNRCVESFSQMWHHHFEFLMLGYGAYLVFFQFCKKAFPEIPDQTVSRMVAGIDILMFRGDDELKKLGKLALELGIDEEFAQDRTPQEILDAVGGCGEPGDKWLAALDEARDPWFNITTGDGFYHYHRAWNDDLTVPFSALVSHIERIRDGENLDRPTEELQTERQRISDEYRELLGSDDEKAAYDQMLGLCHRVFPYVENHKFFCEHWFTARFYEKVREFGDLLVEHGILEDREDIFHLQHWEISQILINVSLAWAAGTKPIASRQWQPVIEQRKEIIEKLKEWDAPVAIGPMPEHLEDPAVQMLWGITAETLNSWARSPDQVDPNEINGYAASPGVVEGIARVLKTVNEIGDVQNGEILVSPITTPSWGPVFGKIKAAVSDIGGTMSHAAIVAREYGLPAVVGTGRATRQIKTGQRIRVDGDKGLVTILEEAS